MYIMLRFSLMPTLPIQQMQWPSLTPILVLALVLAQCTWMKFSALAVKPTSLTATEVLLSTVLLSAHMQEYDVKVCRNGIMILHLSFN